MFKKVTLRKKPTSPLQPFPKSAGTPRVVWHGQNQFHRLVKGEQVPSPPKADTK